MAQGGNNFASEKNALGICDMCSFQYPLQQLKFTSYGTRVCPTDYDGAYDLKNHPQNDPPPISPDPEALRDPRPEVPLDPNQNTDPMEVPLTPGETPE